MEQSIVEARHDKIMALLFALVVSIRAAPRIKHVDRPGKHVPHIDTPPFIQDCRDKNKLT